MKTCEGGLIEFAYGVVEPPGGGTIHHEVDGVACRVHLPPVGGCRSSTACSTRWRSSCHHCFHTPSYLATRGGGGRRQVVHLETDPMSGRGHAVHVARGPPQDPLHTPPKGSVNQLGTGQQERGVLSGTGKVHARCGQEGVRSSVDPRKSAIPPSAK